MRHTICNSCVLLLMSGGGTSDTGLHQAAQPVPLHIPEENTFRFSWFGFQCVETLLVNVSKNKSHCVGCTCWWAPICSVPVYCPVHREHFFASLMVGSWAARKSTFEFMTSVSPNHSFALSRRVEISFSARNFASWVHRKPSATDVASSCCKRKHSNCCWRQSLFRSRLSKPNKITKVSHQMVLLG